MSFLKDTSAGQLLRSFCSKEYVFHQDEVTGLELNNVPFIGNESHLSSQKWAEKPTTNYSTSGGSYTRTSSSIVVDFAEADDENPRNWPAMKKAWTTFLINVYTFVVYCTASIVTPSAGYIVERYRVSIVVASLTLSMYVVGCKLFLSTKSLDLAKTNPRRNRAYVLLALE